MLKRILLVGGSVLLFTSIFLVFQLNYHSEHRAVKAMRAASGESASQTGNQPDPSLRDKPSDSEQNQEEGNPSGSVSGTVRLKSTGEPVPGTLIQVASADLLFENDLTRQLKSLSARADKKGNYTLTGIPPNIELYLKASSPSADLYIGNGDLPVFTLSPGEKKTGVNINLTQGQWRVRKLERDEIADFSGSERNFRHAKIDHFLDLTCRFLTKRRILRIGIPLRMWPLSNSDAVLSGYQPKGVVVPCLGWRFQVSSFLEGLGPILLLAPLDSSASSSYQARTPPRSVFRTIFPPALATNPRSESVSRVRTLFPMSRP
jgi:hypothetical protein